MTTTMASSGIHVPDGYTESQVMAICEEVITMLAEKFKFGHYETDDIKQESWIFVLDGLKKYDPTRGTTLKTFLVTHLRNRLISLRRDKWYRPEPKKMSDERREKWRQRNALKKNLAQPFSIEDMRGVRHENTHTEDFVESIQRAEIFDLIDRELPVEFRRDFMFFLDDVPLPKPRRDKLIEQIREILNAEEG